MSVTAALPYETPVGGAARDLHVSVDGQVHSTGADRYQRLYIHPDGHLQNSGYKDFTYGAAVAPGVYFYRLNAGGMTDIRKMVLAR
jgi:hypothetical protein